MITKIARSLSHYYIQVTTTTLKCNIYQIFLISLIKSTASINTHVVNIITIFRIGKNDGWYAYQVFHVLIRNKNPHDPSRNDTNLYNCILCLIWQFTYNNINVDLCRIVNILYSNIYTFIAKWQEKTCLTHKICLVIILIEIIKTHLNKLEDYSKLIFSYLSCKCLTKML